MRKSIYSHTVMFLAGLVLGALLTVQIPKMLKAQQKRILHPDYRQGFIWETGDPLDIAIEGRGYFQFERPDGTLVYSRYSHFALGEAGALVSKDKGYPTAKAIFIPDTAKRILIDEDGKVSAAFGEDNKILSLGFIELYTFDSPDSLETTFDEHYYQECEKSGPITRLNIGKTGAARLKQGYTMVK